MELVMLVPVVFYLVIEKLSNPNCPIPQEIKYCNNICRHNTVRHIALLGLGQLFIFITPLVFVVLILYNIVDYAISLLDIFTIVFFQKGRLVVKAKSQNVPPRYPF